MHVYTLANNDGMEVSVIPFGAAIVSVKLPADRGETVNVVLGYDSPAEYLSDTSDIAGIFGRYANRIAKGVLRIDDAAYQLTLNDGRHHLHGGPGFHKVMWQVEQVGANQLELSYLSPDGEQGYPGNLAVRVRYALRGDGVLRIEYKATTDAPTVVNLTQHPYFNLAGAGTALSQELTVQASRFLSVDASMIPTGEFREVGRTPFDFREPCAIGARIDDIDPQLRFAAGYDHTFVLDAGSGGLRLAAVLCDPPSGRRLEIHTTEPGLQVYSGNYLKGPRHPKYSGVCLEPQHFPDSPNRPEFPSTILRPGERYESVTEYRFSN